MPVILKIDPRRRLVYSSFYGKFKDEELLKHRSAIASDPDFNRDFSEIVDFSAVKEPSVSQDTLTAMAASQSLFSASALHIVVVPDDTMFKLANQYKALTQKSRPNLHVVRTRADAYRLLGMKPE